VEALIERPDSTDPTDSDEQSPAEGERVTPGEAEAPAAGAPPAPEPDAPEALEPPLSEADAAAGPEPQAAAPAEPPAAEPTAPAAAPDAAPPERPARPGRPDRPRGPRRRPSAAQRHRRAFFAKLSELRSQDEAPAPAEAEAPAEAPAEGEPATEDAAAGAPAQAGTSPARVQARLKAAIERIGGPEAVREALAPKQDADGKPMKWSAVCAEQASGHRPGDPVFTAWARLAVTPVRDVKALVVTRDERGGPRRGGGRGGGRGGPRRPREGDAPRESYARPEDLRRLGRDGSLRTRIRIVHENAPDPDKQERSEKDKAERDAKRQADEERLKRLGY